MRFLIDANLPRALRPALEQKGHVALDVRDIGLDVADDGFIAAYARLHSLCLLTLDFDFADIRSYPPVEYSGIVVFELPPAASWRQIMAQVLRFVDGYEFPNELPGRLAIVAPGSIRVRSG